MAKGKRQTIRKLVRGTVQDVVVPTSMGLGLALGSCSSPGRAVDGPTWAVMPPQMDGSLDMSRTDTRSDLQDAPLYAIVPPRLDGSVERTEVKSFDSALDYAVLPPRLDTADLRDSRVDGRDTPIYAIMPPREPGIDGGLPIDASRDTLPDLGPIYAIMPATKSQT